MESHYDHTENSEKQVDIATNCNNSKLNQESLEESMNPEGHINVTKWKQRVRKNKKTKIFDKHLEIASQGTHKGKNTD